MHRLVGGGIHRLDVRESAANQVQPRFSLDGVEQGVRHAVIDLCGLGEHDWIENDDFKAVCLQP